MKPEILAFTKRSFLYIVIFLAGFFCCKFLSGTSFSFLNTSYFSDSFNDSSKELIEIFDTEIPSENFDLVKLCTDKYIDTMVKKGFDRRTLTTGISFKSNKLKDWIKENIGYLRNTDTIEIRLGVYDNAFLSTFCKMPTCDPTKKNQRITAFFIALDKDGNPARKTDFLGRSSEIPAFNLGGLKP